MNVAPAALAYIDGGARGNPGPAGYGVHMEAPDGSVIAEFHRAIGIATNNVAEYQGLLAALAYAHEHGYRTMLVRSDSELLVKQMNGEYRVKHEGLKPLYERARRLASALDRFTIEHVPRASNAHADRLANLAMDEALGKKD